MTKLSDVTPEIIDVVMSEQTEENHIATHPEEFEALRNVGLRSERLQRWTHAAELLLNVMALDVVLRSAILNGVRIGWYLREHMGAVAECSPELSVLMSDEEMERIRKEIGKQ